MKRVIILLASAVLLIQSFSVFAQEQKKESLVTDGLYVRETIPQRIPTPYPYLREADMMWTKRIWRTIDLREKLNHPLYYPTNYMQDRISLVQRLVNAIKYNEISAYDPLDDEFTTLLSYDQVIKNFGAEDQVKTELNPLTGRDTTRTITGTFDWKNVKEIIIKEEWFFDKQHSSMQVRIIGLCPIIQRTKILNTGGGEETTGSIERVKLFWVYFPEARKVLANTSCFNDFNDAQRITFDDLFFKRRFSSYIIQETNVYDNRPIDQYSYGGIPNMQESERIKNDLFTFEHDLWEF